MKVMTRLKICPTLLPYFYLLIARCTDEGIGVEGEDTEDRVLMAGKGSKLLAVKAPYFDLFVSATRHQLIIMDGSCPDVTEVPLSKCLGLLVRGSVQSSIEDITSQHVLFALAYGFTRVPEIMIEDDQVALLGEVILDHGIISLGGEEERATSVEFIMAIEVNHEGQLRLNAVRNVVYTI